MLSTLQPFEVVIVPFPFTDRQATKRRPALVLSSARFNQDSGHAVLAMITSADQSSWPADVAIKNIASAGLSTACVMRLKLFTLDQRLIVRKAGALAAPDKSALQKAWKAHLPL
jgi:mRNA interferase MazF